MIERFKKYINRIVNERVDHILSREIKWRDEKIKDLERRINLIMSEEFIDETVHRINQKQIK